MFVDLRSKDKCGDDKVEQGFQQAVDAAVQEKNRRWNTDTISAEVEMIGDTPSGTQSIHSVMVQTALGATYSLGQTPDLWGVAGGTDANVPLSLGIPAIHMSAGGFSMCRHSVNECSTPLTPTMVRKAFCWRSFVAHFCIVTGNSLHYAIYGSSVSILDDSLYEIPKAVKKPYRWLLCHNFGIHTEHLFSKIKAQFKQPQQCCTEYRGALAASQRRMKSLHRIAGLMRNMRTKAGLCRVSYRSHVCGF